MNLRVNSEFSEGREFISFISTRIWLKLSGGTEVQNHSGLYRMEISSLAGLVLLSSTKVLIDLVLWCSALPSPGCDFTCSPVEGGCICMLPGGAEWGKGWRRRSRVYASWVLRKIPRSCHERLPHIRTSDWNLVMWSKQGVGFEAKVVENKQSFSVGKSNSFFTYMVFLKQSYLQHFPFWACFLEEPRYVNKDSGKQKSCRCTE